MKKIKNKTKPQGIIVIEQLLADCGVKCDSSAYDEVEQSDDYDAMYTKALAMQIIMAKRTNNIIDMPSPYSLFFTWKDLENISGLRC